MAVSGTQAAVTSVYVGSSRAVTTTSLTVSLNKSGATQTATADCFYASKIYVENDNAIFVGPDDHYFTQVLSTTSLASSNTVTSTTMTITP